MHKTKASAERNRPKAFRQPSASSLRSRSNTMQQKPQKAEKLPSTHNFAAADNSLKMVSKAADVCIPKTRFSSQDRSFRSCSSPRLKYFPAEKIKKLETPPPFSPDPMSALIAQQDPKESGTVYTDAHPEQRRDNGQGDVAVVTQLLEQCRQQQQGMQNASQQQVVPQHPIHQIGHVNPHSECVLPQQVPLNAPQSHRPFVPHVSKEYPTRKNLHTTLQNPAQIVQTPEAVAQQATTTDGEQVKNQEDQINESEADYEKQPVGGRNAAHYRKLLTNAPGKPQTQPPMESAALNQANVNPQYTYNQYSTPSDATQQSPQQIYQQMQQNMFQQQQMQQRAMNYQMQLMNSQQPVENNQGSPANYNSQQYGRYIFGQGQTFTPSQITSQVKNSMNYPMHQLPMDSQNSWAKNNQVSEYSNAKGQVKAYNVEVVGGNQPKYRMQSQQQQQFAPQYQQQPVYQHQQLYRNPIPGNMLMQRQQNVAQNQPTGGFNQQMTPNQQAGNQQPIVQQQNVQQPDKQQQPRENRNGQVQKRVPKFTVAMIRDQEKLLITMRQQQVPIDIMKRQFNILLNEQRKYLEYLEQLHQEDGSEDKRPVPVSRKRKQEDGKPEWMIHLTPPRLSYQEIEKMEEEKRKEREAKQIEMIQQLQQHQPQHQQQQQVPSQQIPMQVTNQQNYQHWQHWQQQQQPQQQQQQQQQQQLQQQPVQQHYNNMYRQPYAVLNPGNVNEPARHINFQQNIPQYAHQHPYQQQFHPQMQQYQQYYQNPPSQNQEQVRSTNTPLYKERRSSTEPSSLLKMRQYRNEIRPQRRNNGLQDPDAAKKQLEELRVTAEARKGLEYLVNMTSRKPMVKLNGMQERNDLDAEFQQRLITSSVPPPVKMISANGLENSRHPDNPPVRRLSDLKRMEQEYAREYPRQRQGNLRNCYSVQAERENGTVAVDQQQMYSQQQQLPCQNVVSVIPYNEKNPIMARGSVMPYRFDGSYPQHYQQMQQYYQNTKNLSMNNGEGDVGTMQKIEQNKDGFDRAGGDANENMNNITGTQMAEGKIPYQGTYYRPVNIHEAKTIGGVRYLARKPDYIPNQQLMASENLVANRQMQPFINY